MLKSFWKIANGFVDFGSGRGIPVLFASFWASYQGHRKRFDVSYVAIQGIERDNIRYLDSILLLECGKFIATRAGLTWPNVELFMDDLENATIWKNVAIKFGFLNNYCYGENEKISTNASEFLKHGMLACFKYSRIPHIVDCIICVAKFENMGQWSGSTVFVLESCSHYFESLYQKCQSKIHAWLMDGEIQSTAALNRIGMFWYAAKMVSTSVASGAELQQEMGKALGWNTEVFHQFSEELFQFVKKQEEYSEMPLLYQPFLLSAVSLMLYLEVLKHSFKNSKMFESNILLRQYLIAAIENVSHKTLPYIYAINYASTITMEMANITQPKTVVECGSKRKTAKSELQFRNCRDIYNRLLCEQKLSGNKKTGITVMFQCHDSKYPNNISVLQFAYFSELLKNCEALGVQLEIDEDDLKKFLEMFIDIIARVRELALRLVEPIIHGQVFKAENEIKFDSYVQSRVEIDSKKLELVDFIEELKMTMKSFKDFDSKFCVSSLSNFMQHEMYFADGDAELVEQLHAEMEYFKIYLSDAYEAFEKCKESEKNANSSSGDDDQDAIAEQLRKEQEKAEIAEREQARRTKAKRDAEAAKKAEQERLASEKAAANAAATADIDILTPLDWTKILKSLKDKTDMGVFNWYVGKLRHQNLNTEQMFDIHKSNNAIEHHCQPFFQKIPDQNCTEQFMFLVPGRPLIFQNASYTSSKEQGVPRIMNLAMAVQLASLPSPTPDQKEALRIADKQSTSLFFTNGSIFLVAMQEKRIRISKKLKKLAWNKSKPKKITAANFYENHTNDDHLGECQQLHIHCGDLLLCIAVEDVDGAGRQIRIDNTNCHKTLEDDVATLLTSNLFNDNTFIDGRQLKYTD